MLSWTNFENTRTDRKRTQQLKKFVSVQIEFVRAPPPPGTHTHLKINFSQNSTPLELTEQIDHSTTTTPCAKFRVKHGFWIQRDICGSHHGSVRSFGSKMGQIHQIGPRNHKPNHNSTQKSPIIQKTLYTTQNVCTQYEVTSDEADRNRELDTTLAKIPTQADRNEPEFGLPSNSTPNSARGRSLPSYTRQFNNYSFLAFFFGIPDWRLSVFCSSPTQGSGRGWKR